MDPRALLDHPLRRVPRERRKRIAQALRTPRVLTDPDDAELLVRTADAQQRLFRWSSATWARLLRLTATVWVLSHAVGLALDGRNGAALTLGGVVTLAWLGLEITSVLTAPRMRAAVEESRRINRAYLESIGRPPPEPLAPGGHDNVPARLAVAALPASFVFVTVGAVIEGDLTSHTRIVLATAVAAGLGGLTCGVGAYLGRRGRREAAAHGGGYGLATLGLVLSTLGVLMYLALAVVVPLTEW